MSAKAAIFVLAWAVAACSCSGNDRMAAAPGAGSSSNPQAAPLKLTNLAFQLLPINSIRGSVRGSDAASGLCAEVIWDYSNTGRDTGRHCDDFGENFPYVHIERGTCAGLHYRGNAQVLASRGCIDFKDFGDPSTDGADITVDVSHPLFTGAIELRGP